MANSSESAWNPKTSWHGTITITIDFCIWQHKQKQIVWWLWWKNIPTCWLISNQSVIIGEDEHGGWDYGSVYAINGQCLVSGRWGGGGRLDQSLHLRLLWYISGCGLYTFLTKDLRKCTIVRPWGNSQLCKPNLGEHERYLQDSLSDWGANALPAHCT